MIREKLILSEFKNKKMEKPIEIEIDREKFEKKVKEMGISDFQFFYNCEEFKKENYLLNNKIISKFEEEINI